jgi:DNA/RNA-binding protein KIN17|eukprot:COSAG01_NODE_15196_length_1362_cov_307.509897_1_plen_303_part_00
MKLFAENSSSYIDTFSADFEASFMDILSRRFRSNRVWSNVVYQEVIADSGHIHMNSTKWESLTGFVKYLGKSGKAIVDEGITPSGQPGLFLKYIVRDVEAVAKQERIKAKEQEEQNEEERQSRMLARQIQKARAAASASGSAESEHVATELRRPEGSEQAAKVAFNVAAATEISAVTKPKPISALVGFSASGGGASAAAGAKRKRSMLDEIMETERQKKQAAAAASRTEWWLQAGIVVKVIHKKLKNGKYHKKKGVVKAVQEKYIGEVRMLDTNHVLRLDQVCLSLPKRVPFAGLTCSSLAG